MSAELQYGKYRLLRRLAHGGMAEVFLARASGAAGFEKSVVIKRLHAPLSEDLEFVTMLIDEARLVSRLTHTNICQVFDLGKVENTYYIALEHIDGHDLFSIMRALSRAGDLLPIRAAIYIVHEMLEGLGYAHRRCDDDGHPLGIVHRDVSPQNVLVTREGEVKVIDFGIAKARLRITKTQAGILKGKFRYMAPEQAAGGEVDHRCDIFATGIVLYELLAGQVHGRGLSDLQLLERVRHAIFEPLRTLRPEVPPALDEIVLYALERDPARRFQSAHEFQDALSRFLQGTGMEYTKRDLGSLVRALFPEGAPRGTPVDADDAATSRATPSAQPVGGGVGGSLDRTSIEQEDELEEIGDDDVEEVRDLTGARAPAAAPDAHVHAAAPRASVEAPPPQEALRQRGPHDEVELAPTTAAQAPRPAFVQAATKPARRRSRIPRPSARQYHQSPAAGPAPVTAPPPVAASPPLDLRAPDPEPFELPQPEPPPAAVTSPPPAAAPAGVPPPAAPASVAAPTERTAVPSERRGLSLGGKVAMLLTVILLGGAAAMVLLFYNPSKYQKLSRRGTRAPVTGSLHITSTPPGAAIIVDGRDTGRRTPDVLGGLPANRLIRLELALPDHEPWSLEVSVTPHEATPVMAELTPATPARSRRPRRRRRAPGRRRGATSAARRGRRALRSRRRRGHT